MISEKLQKAINEQINAELESWYLYLSMAAYFESNNLKGFAHWMRIQAEEERGHARKLYDHIVDRGGRVKLTAIAAPPVEFDSVEDIFRQTLDHERMITSRIHKINELALAEKDFAVSAHLQWFINEQVEEEATADHLLSQIRMVESKPGSLFYIDRHLGKREK